jgi:hypothetical protein
LQPDQEKRFNTIERQRTYLCDSAQALTDAQLIWKPGADYWSVGEVIEHLILSDEAAGRAHGSNVTKREPRRFRAIPRSWRRALILSAFRRNMRLPVPLPGILPRSGLSVAVLLDRWNDVRRGMRADLETQHGDAKRYSHPVIGPLNANEMLEMTEAHTAYHTRQIEGIQRMSAFPADGI